MSSLIAEEKSKNTYRCAHSVKDIRNYCAQREQADQIPSEIFTNYQPSNHIFKGFSSIYPGRTQGRLGSQLVQIFGVAFIW